MQSGMRHMTYFLFRDNNAAVVVNVSTKPLILVLACNSLDVESSSAVPQRQRDKVQGEGTLQSV